MNTEDKNSIENLILNFIKEMNEWEKYCLELEEDDSVSFAEEEKKQKDSLIKIFDKYCTKRDRIQGSPNTLSYGDEDSYIYDENDEKIISIEKEEKNKRATVFTERTQPMKSKFAYVVMNKNDNWLIDSKKRYSEYESKWKVISL